jgi:uncharacterized protein YjbI with pentapeptide repeats
VAEKRYLSIDEITHEGIPLGKILEKHRSWVESDGETGTRADLSRADLSWTDLRYVDLSEAELREANLSAPRTCARPT